MYMHLLTGIYINAIRFYVSDLHLDQAPLIIKEVGGIDKGRQNNFLLVVGCDFLSTAHISVGKGRGDVGMLQKVDKATRP